MDQEEVKPTIIECNLSYSLRDGAGNGAEAGEAAARLDEEKLCIDPKLGQPFSTTFLDMDAVSAADYRIRIALSSGDAVEFSQLGLRYEDFLTNLNRLRSEALLKGMLMGESVVDAGTQGEFARFDEAGGKVEEGSCELRLYETGLVVLPEGGDPVRIPYSLISRAQVGDYLLTVATESGEKLVCSKMGNRFDRFAKLLSDTMNQLSLRVQASLKELAPQEGALVIRRAAGLLRDGRAARVSELRGVSAGIVAALEERMQAAGLKEEYDFLGGLAGSSDPYLGFKRGLMGELTGDYVWYLVPVLGGSPGEPGNALVMGATGDEGGGKATYFFRIVGRNDFAASKDVQEMQIKADALVQQVDLAMLMVNFRREPIYLPDERLKQPQYSGYRFAIGKLPALQTLRRLFIGRVIHSSPEQWRSDATELLKFNTSTTDDGERWKKGAAKDD